MAIQDIVAYLNANKNKFSLDELSQKLRVAGYPEAEIQEALKKYSAPSLEKSEIASSNLPAGEKRLGRKIGLWVLGFFLALILNGVVAVAGFIFLLLYSFGGFRRYYYIPAIIFAVGAAILVGQVLLIIKFRNRFHYFIRGLTAGIAAIVLVFGLYYGYSQVGYRYFSSYRSVPERQFASDMYSRDTRRITDIKQMQLALEMYFDAKTDYPQSIYELLPNYIPSIPVDPYGMQYTYEKRGPRHYYLAAQLEDYGNVALAADVNPGNSLYEVEEGISTNYSPGATDFSIKILSPNGGEMFQQGKRYQIRWAINDLAKIPKGKLSTTNINIRITKKPGIEEGILIADVPLSTVPSHSYLWTIPGNFPAGSYKITVNVYGVVNVTVPEPYWGLPDESDGFFTVIPKR